MENTKMQQSRELYTGIIINSTGTWQRKRSNIDCGYQSRPQETNGVQRKRKFL